MYGIEWMDRVDPTMEIFLPMGFSAGFVAFLAVAYAVALVVTPFLEKAIKRIRPSA